MGFEPDLDWAWFYYKAWARLDLLLAKSKIRSNISDQSEAHRAGLSSLPVLITARRVWWCEGVFLGYSSNINRPYASYSSFASSWFYFEHSVKAILIASQSFHECSSHLFSPRLCIKHQLLFSEVSFRCCSLMLHWICSVYLVFWHVGMETPWNGHLQGCLLFKPKGIRDREKCCINLTIC